ncbi:tRNA pseudouridine(38-40) synthase TruA [Desulfocurvibacter africanus]|uniref:tRNA pseudouridine(38-40) synthase TruA n=1 Tax=Desulfocurvibacter africanus TaxID=873 RepID=UPI002FDA59F9
MPRLKLTLAYTGTRFAGLQIQPGCRTVQGEVEAVLARMLNGPVRIDMAARTDSGVHALGQVVHLDVPESKMRIPWRKAINALLPDDVCVTEVEVVPPEFHSRFSATSKVYAYTIWSELEFILPQRKPFVWRMSGLSQSAMDKAMQHFVGRHDFKSFQNVGTPIRDTRRTVARFWREPGQTQWETVYRIQADGFLKQMVRNIIGCLVAVGRGKLCPNDIPALIAARDRSLAPPTAPSRGLCLERIFFDVKANSTGSRPDEEELDEGD